MRMAALSKKLRRLRDSEDGGVTIFGLYIFMAMLLLAGLAIDVANLIAVRTQLQVAADFAAHTALYVRDTKSEDDAKAAALAAVSSSYSTSRYGELLAPENIVFGSYDASTDTFVPSIGSRKAVLVQTERLAEKANPVSSFLLQLAGFTTWDLRVTSLFTTYRPACFREGFVGEGVVDIQSNNGFSNGFCIHSNTYVSLNSNNTFEAGTVVSMADTTLIDLPKSGWETNEGLGASLREGAYRLRIVNKLPMIIAGLKAFDPTYMPSYITATSFEFEWQSSMTTSELQAGKAYYIVCGQTRLTITGDVLEGVVLISPCPITFSNGMNIRDSIIVSESNSSKALSSSSGLIVGLDDNCGTGGGAQLLTLGSMNFAADLHVFGSQLIAKDDIEFAANADGIQGASMIAGGTVSGTSNMNMGFCGTGMESNFEAEYFRLAR